MAREEHPREDLLQEATALVERVELRVAGFAQAVVAGFRSNGAASWFLGDEPVYQFNAGGELRRAFRAGLLLKAERGLLCSLQRTRTPSATLLMLHHLSDSETKTFLHEAHGDLSRLAQALAAGEFSVTGEVPNGANVLARVQRWLAALPAEIAVASAPGVR